MLLPLNVRALPVWPSLRRPWPPPRSVQQGWGVGQKGVRCRKCCRSDLQGRRRASVHQRHVAGLGHFPSTQLRRRLEVVAEGLCLFGGCQLASDATVVSTLALKEAKRSKEATHPELCRGDGRARLVFIAGEVGGRWSQETKDFLWWLACEKSSKVVEVVLSPCVFHGEGSGLFSGWAPRVR